MTGRNRVRAAMEREVPVAAKGDACICSCDDSVTESVDLFRYTGQDPATRLT